MTENTENLVLEHLRAIRSDMGKMQTNISEIKLRLISIDERLTLTEKGIANIHGDLALLNMRLDSLDTRVERIEKRLDLTEA